MNTAFSVQPATVTLVYADILPADYLWSPDASVDHLSCEAATCSRFCTRALQTEAVSGESGQRGCGKPTRSETRVTDPLCRCRNKAILCSSSEGDAEFAFSRLEHAQPASSHINLEMSDIMCNMSQYITQLITCKSE